MNALDGAERLVRALLEDGRGSARLELDQLTERLPLAIDRAMGEGGLWAPSLAARALRQALGDPVEAAHLLRAHRAALPRLGRTLAVPSADLRVTRRISSAFRNPPGGQVLGRTLDYVGRLLDLLPEEEGRARAAGGAANDVPRAVGERPVHGEGHHHGRSGEQYEHGADGERGAEDTCGQAHGHDHDDHDHDHDHDDHRSHGRGENGGAGGPGRHDGVERAPGSLLSVLRDMDAVLTARPGEDPEPFDVTRRPVTPDAPRSAWLQAMARADTGSLMHMWYGSNWRPSGHEIPGEVRHGSLPVRMRHPYADAVLTVTRVRVSEVQTFHSLARAGELRTTLDVGYGLCFGHNDRKAISMAGLDLLLSHHSEGRGPHHDVLFTLDGLDSTGYVQHLKLPHHVEFRSVVERATAAADRKETAPTETDGDTP
jgi:alpha-D-ribose 1-methylphosphonate 5-triphosphate synthase subunit PhnI